MLARRPLLVVNAAAAQEPPNAVLLPAMVIELNANLSLAIVPEMMLIFAIANWPT